MTRRPPQRPPDPDLLTRLWRDIVLAARLTFDRRVSGKAKVIPLALLIYLLSPIDLVPDILLPLGIVDDITALLIGLQLFIRSAPPEVVREYREGRRRPPAERLRLHETDDPRRPRRGRIIDGEYTVHDDDRGSE